MAHMIIAMMASAIAVISASMYCPPWAFGAIAICCVLIWWAGLEANPHDAP